MKIYKGKAMSKVHQDRMLCRMEEILVHLAQGALFGMIIVFGIIMLTF